MKKITFIILFIIPLITFSQTFNFTNSNDGWTVLSGFNSANATAYMTLTTHDNTAGNLKNPILGIASANVNTSVNSVVGITLRNNDAAGPDYLRVSYPKTTTGRVYVSADITNGDTEFVTYWFNLANANWTGTMNDVKFHFRAAGNADYILPVPQVAIDIDKIEFAASIPTTLQEVYNFDTDDDAEGFTAINGNISGPTGGILTFTPVASQFAKLSQSLRHVNATTNKHVHITLKNNSAANNQLRIEGGGVTRTQVMTTSDASEKTYSFDMTTVTGWTGEQVFVIGIGSDGNGKAVDVGTVEISSVVIDNVLSNDTFERVSFKMYPNPANTNLTINAASPVSKVQIFNIIGNKVLETSLLTNKTLNVSNLNSGIYLIMVFNSENKIATQKLIIN